MILSVVGVGASLWGIRSDMVTQLIAAATTTTLTMTALSEESGAGNRKEDCFFLLVFFNPVQARLFSSTKEKGKKSQGKQRKKEGEK